MDELGIQTSRQVGRCEGKGEGGCLLGQLVVGEGIGVCSLAVESLLGQLNVALLLMDFAIVFALLALIGCCHCEQMTKLIQGILQERVVGDSTAFLGNSNKLLICSRKSLGISLSIRASASHLQAPLDWIM